MLSNVVIVFDFETGSNNEQSCEVVQVGATAINPKNLTIYRDGEFSSLMRPLNPDGLQEGALRVNKKTREELAAAPHPEIVWGQFAEWCKGWALKGKNDGYNSPIAAGHNIIGFDWPILCRYSARYGTVKLNPRNGVYYQSLFNNVWRYDVLHMMASWTENLPEPGKLSLDFLRKYFDMPPTSIANGHVALQDVRDTATILIKLLKLQRRVAPTVIWKDCCNPEKVSAERERRAKLKEAQAVREEEKAQRARGRGWKSD